MIKLHLDIIQEECSIVFEDIHTCSISYQIPKGKALYINNDIYNECGLTIDILTDSNIWFINGKEYYPYNIKYFNIK